MEGFDLELFLAGKRIWDRGQRLSELDAKERAAVDYFRGDKRTRACTDYTMRDALAAEIIRLRETRGE
jgi:hypothetical protein